MSFLANPGFLYAGSVNLKQVEKKMQVKPFHDSLRSLHNDLDNDDRNKLGVPSRVKKNRNRKINLDYRSVWYDGIVDGNDDASPAASLSSGYKLRKASSLDSLLKSSTSNNMRRQLTKDMISAPRSPRKIVNWNDFDRVNELTELDSSAEQLSEKVILEEIVPDNLRSLTMSSNNATNESELSSSTSCREIIENDVDTENIVTESIFIRAMGGIKVIKRDEDDIDDETAHKIKTTPTGDAGNDQGDTTIEVDSEDITVIGNNILRRKDSTIGTDIYTPISRFGRTSADFGHLVSLDYRSKKEHISPEDIYRTLGNNAFSRVQTLDRYQRKTMLESQLSFSPPSPETRERVLANFENSKREYLEDIVSRKNVRQVFLEVPKSQTLVRVEKDGAKFKRKPFRKEDISAPFDLRHIYHVGKKVEPEDAENSSSNLSAMKFLSKSTDEVLRNLQTNKDEPVSRGVGPFPRTDDTHFLTADVQFRSNRLGNDRSRQSKTMDFDVPRRSPSKTQDFDVKGVTKIQLPSSNSQIKLEKNEYIKYQNSTIFTANDSLGKLEALKYNVFLKSVKSLNKREVELRDSSNQVYLLIFDSSKDSKHFMENEKVNNLLDNKTTLSKTLLRLLGKRSSREVLEKKGIYQNEPIFGNTLRNIFNSEKGVPRFITKTMELIENHENVISLGLYRACGNLATIQKIRLEVDKGNLDILDTYSKDPDVLTGGLKLFFRELKEPLMSCQTCDNLLGIIKNNKNYSGKDKVMIRTILSHLPEANSETLSVLLKHLVEVVKYKDQNKMDTYNLATCWGPTVIFATESSDSNYTKDLVTQSAEATRLFDSLLTYYSMYPEELDFRKRKHDYSDSNKHMLHREDSKDSIHSSDSGHYKLQKKSSSSLSLEGIDEAVKKCVELIENTSTDGSHKKSGSTERVNKIVKKMTKKKTAEMDKYKNDVYELIEALKKYLKQDSERLVTKEAVEQIKKICDNKNCLEHSTRQKVISIIKDLPKKETLIFLLKNLLKLIEIEEFYRESKSNLIFTWSKILASEQTFQSEEASINFLKILLDVFDETKSDISTKPRGIPDGLLESLKNHPNMKDRVSKYDNVPDETDFYKEETILEEKTDEYENTKL